MSGDLGQPKRPGSDGDCLQIACMVSELWDF